MKIKSPLTNKQEVEVLCDAGATELFCGIEPPLWKKGFEGLGINQRSAEGNFAKFTDLKKAIRVAHRRKVKVHVAMNAFLYLEEQYRVAESIIKELVDLGADGIIFADPALLKNINKSLLRNKDVIIGCDATIFNFASVNFYKRLGATRIVLPRSMTVQEMGELVKCDASLEYEVFIMNDLCFFEDAFCAFCKEESGGIKGDFKKGDNICVSYSSRIPARDRSISCRSSFSRYRFSLSGKKGLTAKGPFHFWDGRPPRGCGSCALYDFKKMGIASLKILDRNSPTELKVKATRFIRKSLAFLKSDSVPRTYYVEKCRHLFRQTYKTNCRIKDCYYP